MLNFKILFLMIFIGNVILVFQNCSQFSDPSTSSFAESMPIDNHVTSKLELPQQQIRLVNRRYVTELFRDIFTAADGTTASNMEAYIFHWVSKRGVQLGGSCDLLDSTTGVDCNSDFNNVNQPAYADPNTIRESFKIQLCEELLGQDQGLSIVLNKIGVSDNDENRFSSEKLQLAYELFYRTDEIPVYYMETLNEFILDLQQKNESTNNIWRGVLMLICESPDWQKL